MGANINAIGLDDVTVVLLVSKKFTTYKIIDERNLIHCLFWNINESAIAQLETIHPNNLRILILRKTSINHLCTISLLYLEYIHVGYTNISEYIHNLKKNISALCTVIRTC